VSGQTLAQDGDIDGLVDAIGAAWALKPDGATWKGCTEESAANVSMRAIGG
jgi:cyclic pyranopterin phosphate synthase